MCCFVGTQLVTSTPVSHTNTSKQRRAEVERGEGVLGGTASREEGRRSERMRGVTGWQPHAHGGLACLVGPSDLRPTLQTDQMGDPRSHKINGNRRRVGEVGKRLEAGVAL